MPLGEDRSLEDPLPADPLALIGRWLDEAVDRNVQPNPFAMTLGTVDAQGRPTARQVLCRGFDRERGFFVFYTNYESAKARHLEASPRAALVFHWDGLQRQIRVEGPVLRSPEAESDDYFATRPRDAQLSAWASRQSEPTASRAVLLEAVRKAEARFAGAVVPRPPQWGGYRMWAERVELWVGRAGRVHDRGLWRRALAPRPDGYRGGDWEVTRLQP